MNNAIKKIHKNFVIKYSDHLKDLMVYTKRKLDLLMNEGLNKKLIEKLVMKKIITEKMLHQNLNFEF